jgi:peptidoglycan/xylan/chitin deacetylase (PgdA/CDA1 family)
VLSKKLKTIRFRLYQAFEEQAVRALSPIFPRQYLEKRINPQVIAPFYHIVSDERVGHVIHLYSYRDTDRFKADLDFFLNNYQPIDLYDLVDAVREGKKLKGKVFLLSFDDGFREIYDVVAPILKAKGVPAIFFLTTSFLDNKTLGYRQKASVLVENFEKLNHNPTIVKKIAEVLRCNGVDKSKIKNSILSLDCIRHETLDEIASVLEVDFENYLSSIKPYLTSDQVRSLINDGFYVGAHSVDHRRYSTLSQEEQVSQTINSTTEIKQKFELDYSLFAFPFSDYGTRKSLFDELHNRVDIFFGTSAFSNDFIVNMIQRFWMENTDRSADKILNRLYVRNQIREFTGRNLFKR